MLELEQALSQARAAWMAGRSAVGHCPPDWREAIGEGPAGEAALAALVAHATQAVFRPLAPALTLRPLLPQLPAPQPSPEARSRLRRLLALKGEEAGKRALVRLVAARGHVMHPADWMPGPRDDWAPEVYAPWLAWAASEKAIARAHTLSGETLSAEETYGDWTWAERRARLAAMRRTDPAAARTIIVAKAGSEPAERRLKLVELLEQGLAAEDVPFLESLASDRSDQVKALARRLLARLGRGVGDGELAAELAGMIELTKVGLIRRRRRLELKGLKTQAQENRRRELLGLVSLPDLAGALGVAEAALAESAPTGEPGSTLRFVELVAETGAEATRRALLQTILEDADAPLGLVVPLGARAAPEERAAGVAAVMAREPSPHFPVSLAFAGETLGGAPPRALMQSPGYQAFAELLRAAGGDDEAARGRADQQLRPALANLGLLLDPAAARAVIEACVAAGLSSADPRLDHLHLNAALNPERPT